MFASTALILIGGFALVNYYRGRRLFHPRSLVNALMACFFFALFAQIALEGSHTYWQTFVGIAVWLRLEGWGLYFSAFHGRWNRAESEVRLIDWIGFRLVPWIGPDDLRSNRARGTLCMSLRGLFILPLFGLLFGLSVPALMFGAAAGLTQGIIYGAMRFVPEERAVETAEPITAGVFGAFIATLNLML